MSINDKDWHVIIRFKDGTVIEEGGIYNLGTSHGDFFIWKNDMGCQSWPQKDIEDIELDQR